MIKAILFDWGGVMCEDSDSYTARALSKQFGLDKEALDYSLSTIEAEYSTVSRCDEFFDRAIKTNNLPISITKLKQLFNETPTRQVMLDLAKQMKKKGFIIAIFSSQMKIRADFIQKNNDLSYFDYLFFSNEMGLKKPNKNAFEFVLKKMGLPAESCFFIDDSKKNISVATKMGIKSILFKNVKQCKQKLSEL